MSKGGIIHNSSRPELTTEAFPPLKADHPLVTGDKTCPGCEKGFEKGDVTCLVAVGPGDDPEERKRARGSSYYNAVSLPCHYACVTGIEPSFCPICGEMAIGLSQEGQHMESAHPGEIAKRLTDAGFEKQPDGSWFDLLADPNG